MEKIVFPTKKLGKILGKNKNNLKRLERTFDAKIEISSSDDMTEITIKSKKKDSGFEEYIIVNVVEALAFSFDLNTALLLRNTNYILRKIDIKGMIKGPRVSVVGGRIIGRQGKTKQLLEKASECDIVLRDHVVGIIGRTENVELANQAILALIRGAPQSRVVGHLEKDMARLKALGKEPIEEMIKE